MRLITIDRCLLLWAALLLATSASAEITVRLDSTPVVDQSFQIVFETDSQPDGEPDFAPLERALTILGTSTSSSTQITNNLFNHTIQWIVTVIANRPGELTIPMIAFGSEHSQPTRVTVSATGQGGSTKTDAGSRDIFIEVSSSTTEPYLFAEVIYSVKLYIALQTSGPSLSDPETEGSDLVTMKIGEDRDSRTTINGRQYVVVERSYALFPQQSGPLTIKPIVFTAQRGGSRSFFDPFRNQQTLVVRSDPLRLNVRPIPSTGSALSKWLPARGVEVEEQWSVDPDQLKVGEAVTRTLVIRAHGQLASRIPEPPQTLSDTFKAYPDQAKLEEQQSRSGITGIRRQKIALIPLQQGEYRLPAITIPWWNTVSGHSELAQLPERTIKVAPGAVISRDNIEATSPVPAPADDNANLQQRDLEGGGQPVLEDPIWRWSTIAMIIIWLVTLLLWWLSRDRKGSNNLSDDSTPSPTPSAQAARRTLFKALQRNDPHPVARALLQWAHTQPWDTPPLSLHQIAENYAPSPLSGEIERLSAALYKNHAAERWSPEALREALNRAGGSNELHAGDGYPTELDPLYL